VQQGVNIEAKMTKKRITTNSSNKYASSEIVILKAFMFKKIYMWYCFGLKIKDNID